MSTESKTPKSRVKSPVSIYIVHHPECKEAQALSAKLYDWFRLGYLSGDSSGAGLPVYFRRQVREIHEAQTGTPQLDSSWRLYPKIEHEHAKLNVIIVLVDHRMVVEDKWRGAIVALSKQVSEAKDVARKRHKRSPMELLPAALHDSFYRTGPLSGNFNSVRLAGLNPANQEAALRRAATEMTGRLLRAANETGFKQLDVFLSHAKKDGLKIAETLRDGIRRFGQLEPWFDANDLAWGQRWQNEIEVATTDTAAMVAVVTDAYPTRPWCRTEARDARTPRMLSHHQKVWCMQPMVAVLDPGSTWTRAMPMLEGVPRIGWHPSPSVDPTEYIVDRLVLETMLAQVHREVAIDLDSADQEQTDVCFITWVPDSWSLSKMRAVMDTPSDASTVELAERPSAKIRKIIYPGYGLTPSEEDDLKPAIHSFSSTTELVSYEDYWLTCEKKDFPKAHDLGRRLLIALSSDGTAVELADLGLGTEHCDELMVRLAMRLLNRDQRLAFGGTLVQDRSKLNEPAMVDGPSKSPTSTLAEHLISAALNWQSETGFVHGECDPNHSHQSNITKPGTWPLVNYSAWPIYVDLAPEWKATLVGVCDFRNVRPVDFSDAEMLRFSTDRETDPGARLRHADALTELRKLSAKEADLRIVWGGQIKGSPGWMPGILEEVYQTLIYRDANHPNLRKPLLILGGFGGCAGMLAEYLMSRDAAWPHQLMPPSDPLRDDLLTELERDSQRRVFEDCKRTLAHFRLLLWKKKTRDPNEIEPDGQSSKKSKEPIDDPDPNGTRVNGVEADTIWLALKEFRPRNATWLVMKAVEDVIRYLPNASDVETSRNGLKPVGTTPPAERRAAHAERPDRRKRRNRRGTT
ncbi:MAG: TIR domain-containing protein [Planctomycetales bacterium]